MIKKKKVTTALSAELLKKACQLTDTNQTDTIILGLQELVRSHKRASILKLKGKLHFNFDINTERQRTRT